MRNACNAADTNECGQSSHSKCSSLRCEGGARNRRQTRTGWQLIRCELTEERRGGGESRDWSTPSSNLNTPHFPPTHNSAHTAHSAHSAELTVNAQCNADHFTVAPFLHAGLGACCVAHTRPPPLFLFLHHGLSCVCLLCSLPSLPSLPSLAAAAAMSAVVRGVTSALECFVAGVLDSIRFPHTAIFFVTSKVVRVRFMQCLVLNGGIFLSSVLLADYVLTPAFHWLLDVDTNTPLTISWLPSTLSSLLLSVFYLVWVYPLYAISFLLNAIWYVTPAHRPCCTARSCCVVAVRR